MKKLALVLVSMIIISCNCTKKSVANETIKEVSFEQWVAGVQGGGSGINFMVELNKPLEEGTTLEKVQFKTYEAVFEVKSELLYVTYIRTKVNQLQLYDDAKKEYGNEAPLPDFGLKTNQARLFFNENGKTKEVLIDNVIEKPLLAYPSMNQSKK
ncbi:MAG: hypothetical protein MUF43_03735 [Flavobacterium sp.]|jgi:hypothetical protein|nr:hypothetical protein [Flavobacterium sp.]